MYLRTFNKTEARSLIRQGFSDKLNEDAIDNVLTITGRHPYFMQGILGKVWEAQQSLSGTTTSEIKTFAREFLDEHRDMQNWIKMFGEAEHHVYRILANTPNGVATIAQIRGSIRLDLVCKVEDALRVLSYHGVIDDTDEDEPCVCGTMFRKWYLNNYPEPTPKTSLPKELPSNTDRKVEATSFSPVIQVTVNPSIAVTSNSSSATTISLTDAQRVIDEMKQLVAGLAINEISKKKATLELEKASLEVQSAVDEKQVNTGEVESALKKASGILKGAGATAEALRSYIDKAKALGPYIGMVANWIFNPIGS